jgi:riboflavin kinase/FMN adenylyltransferase
MNPTRIEGVVTPFKGNGRKFVYPTANIKSNTESTDGVYFGFADMGEFSNHPAVIFVGTPTTVGDKDRRVEAHLLDIPDKDYYDEKLTLNLEYYHRPNKTFKDIEALKQAMADDDTSARQWFGRASNGTDRP